jgi:hypothetical protein
VSGRTETRAEARASTSRAPETPLSLLLPRDHARLDAMLASILELVHVDLPPQLSARWALYEDGLLAHLDAEEMYLLPELSRHDARRAAVIRAEHATLRAHLAEVGVGLELHIVREDQMQRLAAFLRRHAQAEEADVYRWADGNLDEGSRRGLLGRLRMAWERSWSSPRAAVPPTSAPRPRVAKRPTI